MSGIGALAFLLLAAQARDSIEAVRFTGNRTFTGRELITVVSTRRGQPLDERRLDLDMRQLEAFYHDNGFDEVRVGRRVARGRRLFVVVFNVIEGPRTKIAVVAFSGNLVFTAEELERAIPARPGRFKELGMLEASEDSIKSLYSNSGYPFVRVSGSWNGGQVEGRSQKPEGRGQNQGQDTLPSGLEPQDEGQLAGAALVLEIEEGPRCVIGAVRIRGNQTVRTATVLRATEIKPGRLVRLKDLQAAQRRLYATKLFQRVVFNLERPDTTSDRTQRTQSTQSVRIPDPGPLTPDTGVNHQDTKRTKGPDNSKSKTQNPESRPGPLTPDPESVVVRFDVAEQAYRIFSFGGGFETPPFLLLTAVGWEHDNLFNQGQQLAIDFEFSPGFRGEYRASAEATWRVPYLILTRHDLFVRPFASLEKFDSVPKKEIGIETGLSRNVASHLVVGLFNRVRLVSDTSGSITNALGLDVQFDSRDDVFETRSGVYFRPLAEAAGGLLGGDNDFYRLSGEVRGFVSPGLGVVVAGRVMAGRVFPYGRTRVVPYFESFTLGGRNSLRGYDDQSLGPDSTGPIAGGGKRFGPQVLNANLELRSPYAFGWVGLVGFLDVGEVTSTDAGFSVAALEYAAGLGLRVATPIGPARLDWGKRLHHAEPGDRGRLYLGLLHAF